MNTKILEYLLAIEEEKSVSRAADRFYLSQPVMSRHLKKVEENLGTPLFYRNRNGLALTDAGILYMNGARAILHAQRELEQDLAAMRQQGDKTLRLLIDAPFYNFFMLNTYQPFLESHPGITLDVGSLEGEQLMHRFREGQANLAICLSADGIIQGTESVPLMEDDLALIYPPDYRGPVSLEALGEESDKEKDRKILAALHPAGTSFRILEDQLLERAGISPGPVLEARSFHKVLSFVLHGRCCAFFPLGFYEAYREQIVPLPVSPPLQHFYLLLCYSSSTAKFPPARDLRKRISQDYSAFANYIDNDIVALDDFSHQWREF